ncbi:MAG: VWA domain-containing protein [Pyrinomonadaceae bacterium]
MFIKLAARPLWLIVLSFVFSHLIFAQANQYKVGPPKPPSDDTVRVSTEEIKLNVTVKNDFGHFDPSLQPQDLMVVEDRTPHTIESLRHVPASVLIVLDTGGELRLAKNLKTTRAVAMNLVQSLSDENSLALMQYSDKAEILTEWTTDKAQILETLLTKSNFGKRSRFVEAMNLAAKFLENRPNENRHLVLITDGTDSMSSFNERQTAFKKLLAANVSVHILSYTMLEQKENAGRSIMVQGGEARAPRRTDDGHKSTLPQPIQDLMNLPRLGSINTDREMLKAAKQRQQDLRNSQKELETLAKETGGAIFLPVNLDEMPAEAREIAGTIDSQYVLTYIPKRALADSPAGEVREIGVVPRRVGIIVEARRKFVVPAK